MKPTALRVVAVCLSLCAATIVHAQSTYSSPSRWNNFHPDSAPATVAADAKQAETEPPLPPPGTAHRTSMTVPRLASAGLHSAALHSAGLSSDSVDSAPPIAHQAQSPYSSPYMDAMTTPCNSRPPLFPWFGSSDLLFLTLAEGPGDYLATGLGDDFTSSLVDPDATVGFDVSVGRYLSDGRWGIGARYLLWNPGLQDVTRFGGAGTITTARSAYNDLSINLPGPGIVNVYDQIATNATGMYIKRDVAFQGIEANLYGFGLMGARRAAFTNCRPTPFLDGCSTHARRHSFGGATGPLIRDDAGRMRMVTSHGFRWFQAKDFVERGYDVDGTLGFQADDIYEKVNIQNNLYGYQFGAQLTYMMTCRLNLNVGGKGGLYGNQVEMENCIGSRNTLAYQTATTAPLCNGTSADASDIALATLGELDLGLGYRVSCAWSVRGGYRLLGMTGVANAIDSHPASYASLNDAFRVKADDSYILHGGYVGLEFNW
jgi:hypothetical protein